MRTALFSPLLLALSGVLSVSPVHAGETILLSDEKQVYHLNPYVDARAAPPGELLPREAFETGREVPFAKFGYSSSAAWVRFTLHNPQTIPELRILTVKPVLIDELTLYRLSPQGEVLGKQEFRLSASGEERIIDSRIPAFWIEVDPGETGHFALRARSVHNMTLHLQLSTEEAALKSANREQLILVLYYGVMLAIFFLNLFLYISTREKSYRAYILFVLSLAVMLACLNGVIDYLVPGVNVGRYQITFSALTLGFGLHFTQVFLKTRELMPVAHRVLQGILIFSASVGALGATPLLFVENIRLGNAIDLAIAVSVVAIFTSGCVAFARGFKPALYFIISWSMFLVMVLVYFAGAYGLIEETVLTRYAVQIGSAFEMILLSLALAKQVSVLQQERMEAEYRARDAERLRSLVRVTCHDLGNPLTVILGYTYLKARDSDDPHWSSVDRAARELKAILDQVKAEQLLDSQLPSALQAVSVREAIDNARFIFAQGLTGKDLRLTTSLDSSAGDFLVQANRVLFCHTVMNNLISNAIKFSDPGGQIEVRTWVDGEWVEIEVEDQGVGIPRAQLKRVFEMDVNESRVGTQGEPGTGFGMPLVKRAVEQWGGRIAIRSSCREESSEPSGTTVTVRLRAAVSAGQVAIRESYPVCKTHRHAPGSPPYSEVPGSPFSEARTEP